MSHRGLLRAAMVAAALAFTVPAASAQASGIWEGTWLISFSVAGGHMTITQSGDSFTGTYQGSNTLSGTSSTDPKTGAIVATGTWRYPDGNHGTFEWTMSPGGTYFEGRFKHDTDTYESCGCPWSGERQTPRPPIACEAQASSPCPPPKTIPAAQKWGQPAQGVQMYAGSSAVAVSPPVGKKQKTARVTVLLSQTWNVTAIVLAGRQATPGDCVRDALADSIKAHDQEVVELTKGETAALEKVPAQYRDQVRSATVIAFVETMADCLDYLQRLQKRRLGQAASAGCSQDAVRLAVRRSAGTISYTTHVQKRPNVVVSCQKTATGMTLTIRPRSRSARLIDVVGPRLVFGLYMDPNAQGAVTMTPTFAKH